jgi:putative SOS response-associated peptidase YedK
MHKKQGNMGLNNRFLDRYKNGMMRPVHDRQPVILEPRDYWKWLADVERRRLTCCGCFPMST